MTVSHLCRWAFVYPRQSSRGQLERNVESTARQYALVDRAIELGFGREQVVVIDEDLGVTADGTADRRGFARLTAEVALGHAGLVLGIECSRLSRNDVDWYRLLELCGVTDKVHSVLTNPAYAGAYAFGKTRRERYVDEHGQPRKRTRQLPQAEREVLIWEHHPGFIDKATFEQNRQRLAGNTRPRAHESGGAVREGQALLQGIAVCGRCARKLKVHYQGRRGQTRPAYHCPGSVLVEGRGQWCLRVGGVQVDEAVTAALLAALTPAGVKAALAAAEALEQDHDAALSQWRLQLERARYEAERAERRYRQVEPEHRLVARGLERDWERALTALAEAEAELALRERQRPRTLTDTERQQLLALGSDLARVWSAPSTTDRDRKQLYQIPARVGPALWAHARLTDTPAAQYAAWGKAPE